MKVYKLAPKHKHLLQDHSSGYWWIRPMKQSLKYHGRVIYSADFGEELNKSVELRVARRRLYPWLMQFEKIGYILGNMNFVKLLDCQEASTDNMNRALAVKNEMVLEEKRNLRKLAVQKTQLKKFGPGHVTKGKKVWKTKRPRTVWVWSFKNEALDKRYIHIFCFVDSGVVIGKYRREFCDRYGLKYETMQQLAKGLIKSHQGWSLIDKPRKIGYTEAVAWKIELVKQGCKY